MGLWTALGGAPPSSLSLHLPGEGISLQLSCSWPEGAATHLLGSEVPLPIWCSPDAPRARPTFPGLNPLPLGSSKMGWESAWRVALEGVSGDLGSLDLQGGGHSRRVPADARISDSFHDDNRLLIQELFIVHIKHSCPHLWAGRDHSQMSVWPSCLARDRPAFRGPSCWLWATGPASSPPGGCEGTWAFSSISPLSCASS